jgi:RNA polymerase sigma-70 factor (ECF subfamily)
MARSFSQRDVPLERRLADDEWLRRFHDGDREVLAQCYRESFRAVQGAVMSRLPGADGETVVHEVFFRLVSMRTFREGFRGGSLTAWLTTVAKNQAVDFLRRRRFEEPAGIDLAPAAASAPTTVAGELAQRIDVRRDVERFLQKLPAKWHGVFHARFVEQLNQSEAAQQLGITRTTLIYQELRVRHLLKQFFRDDDGADE